MNIMQNNYIHKFSYFKYGGKFKIINTIINVRIFHNKIKGYYIHNYCFNSKLLIDIGSGRGSDLKYWVDSRIKHVIGIEPSNNSIIQAINKYRNYNCGKNGKINKITITYLNGLGNRIWYSDSAVLRSQDKKKFKYFFQIKNVKAHNINLFWSIHYMMNCESDFHDMCYNINNHIKKNGILSILCMDGDKIDHYLKKNNGKYIIKNDNDIVVFKLNALYEYKHKLISNYGNKILVTIPGTYGLEKGIEENLVKLDNLIFELKKFGFKLISKKNFLDIKINEHNLLNSYEKKISNLYIGLVFKKII